MVSLQGSLSPKGLTIIVLILSYHTSQIVSNAFQIFTHHRTLTSSWTLEQIWYSSDLILSSLLNLILNPCSLFRYGFVLTYCHEIISMPFFSSSESSICIQNLFSAQILWLRFLVASYTNEILIELIGLTQVCTNTIEIDFDSIWRIALVKSKYCFLLVCNPSYDLLDASICYSQTRP